MCFLFYFHNFHSQNVKLFGRPTRFSKGCTVMPRKDAGPDSARCAGGDTLASCVQDTHRGRPMNLVGRIHRGLCRMDLTATICLMKPMQHRPRTPISQFPRGPGKTLAKLFTFHKSTWTLIWNTFRSLHGAKFTSTSFQSFMVIVFMDRNFMECFFKVTCASFKFFMITNYHFSRSHVPFFHGKRCIISWVHAITTFATHKLKVGITPFAQI